MKLKTRQVTADDEGIRPAGRPDACFYCGRKVGNYHAVECVILKRKCRVRLTVEYEVEVPQTWDATQVAFHRNGSSWCAGNAIEELQKLDDGCLCQHAEFEVYDEEAEGWVEYDA